MCFSLFFTYVYFSYVYLCFFFKQKTAYEMRISDWSSDVCSSDLLQRGDHLGAAGVAGVAVEVGAGEAVAGEEAVDHRPHALADEGGNEIGRASCRERVCQYV